MSAKLQPKTKISRPSQKRSSEDKWFTIATNFVLLLFFTITFMIGCMSGALFMKYYQPTPTPISEVAVVLTPSATSTLRVSSTPLATISTTLPHPSPSPSLNPTSTETSTAIFISSPSATPSTVATPITPTPANPTPEPTVPPPSNDGCANNTDYGCTTPSSVATPITPTPANPTPEPTVPPPPNDGCANNTDYGCTTPSPIAIPITPTPANPTPEPTLPPPSTDECANSTDYDVCHYISSCSPPDYFQEIWRVHPELGCPTSSLTSDFSFQTFQGGILAWQKSPSPSVIYALFNNGYWERQTDPEGPPEPSCSEAEQTGGLGPIFGFGKLWCENANWREGLGMPTSGENDGENNQIQNFENGTVLTIGAAGGFIMYSDNHWE